MPMRKRLLVTSIIALLGVGTLVGCAADGPDESEASGAATSHDPAKLTPDAARLDVTVKEWAVEMSATSIKAGKVNIIARNSGTMTHEMVILRGETADALPHNSDGSINEDEVKAADAVGEIAEFDAGKTCGRTFDLAPGRYVVFCNIVMGDVVHAKNGMVTTLTVV